MSLSKGNGYMMDLSNENLELLKEFEEPSKDVLENICIKCGSYDMSMDNTTHTLICDDCGTVNDYYLDKNPEWANYDDKNNSGSRCGCATNYLLPNSSFGTRIDERCQLSQTLLRSSKDYIDRMFYEVIKEYENRGRKHYVPAPIIDNAKHLYKQMVEKKHEFGENKGKRVIIRATNRQSIKAACIFYGAKKQGIPLSPEEIVAIFDNKLTLKDVNSGCRKLLNYIGNYSIVQNIPSSEPGDFIKRFKNKLKVNQQFITIAIYVAKNVDTLGIASNHQPISVAAASMLLTSNFHKLQLTKKSIAECFNRTEVTLTKTYKKIEKWKKYVMDDYLTHKKFKKSQDPDDREAIELEYELALLEKQYILQNGTLVLREEKTKTENDFISPMEMYDNFKPMIANDCK